MDTNTPALGRKWMFNDLYGFAEPPTESEMAAFGKALLVCANGDGKLSQEERTWVVGLYAARGCSAEFAEALQRYDASDDIAALLDSTAKTSNARRSLIYLAVRACAADGELHPEEWQTILKMATRLNIEPAIAEQIRALHEQEAALRQKRIELIYPNGIC